MSPLFRTLAMMAALLAAVVPTNAFSVPGVRLPFQPKGVRQRSSEAWTSLKSFKTNMPTFRLGGTRRQAWADAGTPALSMGHPSLRRLIAGSDGRQHAATSLSRPVFSTSLAGKWRLAWKAMCSHMLALLVAFVVVQGCTLQVRVRAGCVCYARCPCPSRPGSRADL